LHPALAAVVMRCLEKDLSRRYANVGELALALAPYAAPTSRVSVERVLAILGMSHAVPPAPASPPSTTLTIQGAVPRPAITPNTSTSFGHTGGENKAARGNRTAWWVAAPTLLLLIGGGWLGFRALRPETKSVAIETATQPSASAAATSAPEPLPIATAEISAADAAARAAKPAEPEETPPPVAESAHAAPSATSAPLEPRRVATPAPPSKPPVRRPSNPVRSAPLSNILDGRE
jgi:serine/threonine-protein kinase